MERLKEKYQKEIAPKIVKEFKLSNVMEVSRLVKICINSGIGGFRENKEAVESFVSDLSALSGQKPYSRGARLSESGFKIRKGDTVGYAVTLRGNRMWSFLDKLVNISLPRVRDFRGLDPNSFDSRGNYSLGIKEHVIFPEVNPNTTKGIRSLQVTIVFNSDNLEMNRALLKGFGLPFRNEDK